MSEHMPDEDRLRSILVGRRVVGAEVSEDSPPDAYSSGPTGTLTLDDGTVLKVWGNDGGCACTAGRYPLADLNTCDAAIMNVEVEEAPDDDYGTCDCGEYGCEHVGFYRVFVLSFPNAERTLLASFEGSDGNGYYGTGWWLSVEREAVAS